MARITVEDCIDKFPSRFELVLVASQRARNLHSGDNPTVEKNNDKNTVIALREIADETLTIDSMKNSLVEEYQTVSSQAEEDLTLEYEDSENDNVDQINQDEEPNSNEDTDTNQNNEESITLENQDSDIETPKSPIDNIEENLEKDTN